MRFGTNQTLLSTINYAADNSWFLVNWAWLISCPRARWQKATCLFRQSKSNELGWVDRRHAWQSSHFQCSCHSAAEHARSAVHECMHTSVHSPISLIKCPSACLHWQFDIIRHFGMAASRSAWGVFVGLSNWRHFPHIFFIWYNQLFISSEMTNQLLSLPYQLSKVHAHGQMDHSAE